MGDEKEAVSTLRVMLTDEWTVHELQTLLDSFERSYNGFATFYFLAGGIGEPARDAGRHSAAILARVAEAIAASAERSPDGATPARPARRGEAREEDAGAGRTRGPNVGRVVWSAEVDTLKVVSPLRITRVSIASPGILELAGVRQVIQAMAWAYSSLKGALTSKEELELEREKLYMGAAIRLRRDANALGEAARDYILQQFARETFTKGQARVGDIARHPKVVDVALGAEQAGLRALADHEPSR